MSNSDVETSKESVEAINKQADDELVQLKSSTKEKIKKLAAKDLMSKVTLYTLKINLYF